MFEQNSLGRERPTDLGRLLESFSVASVSFVVDLGMMNSLIIANSIMDALREGYASQLIQYYQ
ncbi:hypothetical protein KA531_03075, partial [Candidatus Saccharibacteria bacterium]|nr:hypothetical protein [Candidatus Saccharibacteria bacterium]